MMLFLSILLVAASGSMMTRLLSPSLHTDSSALQIPARMILAAAVVVCLMNTLQRLLPGDSSAWIVVSIFFLGSCYYLSTQKQSDKQKPETAMIGIVLLIGSFVFLSRMYGTVIIGSLVPLEGTGVHDEFWYISLADWLANNSLSDRAENDPLFPWQYAGRFQIDLLPRIGGESLLVFFSTLSGMPNYQVYPVISAIGCVLLTYCSLLYMQAKQRWTTAQFALALLVSSLSPVALFIWGNGNFATLFGLIFFAAFYWFLRDGLTNVNTKTSILAASVCASAMVATYPELLMIAVPSTVLTATILCCSRRIRPWTLLQKTLLCVVVSIALTPFAVLDAFRVFISIKSAVDQGNVSYFSLFSDVGWQNAMTALFIFDGGAIENTLGSTVAMAANLIVLLTLLSSPRFILSSISAMLLSCLFSLVYFWFKDYGYGGMKAIEFLALPASTIFGCAVVNLIFSESSPFESGKRSAVTSNKNICPG